MSTTKLATPCVEWTGARVTKGYGVKHVKGEGRQELVHRWVMAQVHGWPALEGKQVLHHCDNPPCYRFSHLAIGTHADNMADMAAKGRQRNATGEANTQVKLTEAQVLEICDHLDAGELNQREIGALFGVSRQAVNEISTGRNWNYLTNRRTS